MDGVFWEFGHLGRYPVEHYVVLLFRSGRSIRSSTREDYSRRIKIESSFSQLDINTPSRMGLSDLTLDLILTFASLFIGVFPTHRYTSHCPQDVGRRPEVMT